MYVCPLLLVKVSLHDCHLKSVASIQTKLGNNDHWWGNGGEVKDLEVRGHLGVKGVNCHGNVLGPPNLVKRTTDLNAEQCWGPRSCRGHLGSSRGQFPWECPRTIKLGQKNHWPKHKTMLRSKVMQGSSGSSRGQLKCFTDKYQVKVHSSFFDRYSRRDLWFANQLVRTNIHCSLSQMLSPL